MRTLRTLGPLVAVGLLVFAAWFYGTTSEHPANARRPPVVTDPAEFRLPAGGPPESPAERTVVVMLIDGLAPAMVEAQETPALDRLRREGAWTHHMVPPFPSMSLSSGFTISTGCWPERHGIVTNRFFDPERGFYDHSRDADWVTACEQLHEVAERQGVRTAALGWYGEVSASRGKLASTVRYAATWEEYPPDDRRAEQITELLGLPEAERPQLILAYFKGPDEVAHFRAIDDAEVREAVAAADRMVGAVLGAIEAQGLEDGVALIVTTDHGLVPVTQLINVDYILRKHGIDARMVATGTTAFVYLDDPSTRADALAKLSGYPEFDLILPEAPPPWSHLGSGPRTGDFIVSARPGFAIEDRGMWPWFLRWLAWVGPEVVGSQILVASHGYPPDTPGIEGVLYAWGAGVRTGRELGRIDAVDIHPTVTHLLGIAPGEPVDGEVVRELVADPDAAP